MKMTRWSVLLPTAQSWFNHYTPRPHRLHPGLMLINLYLIFIFLAFSLHRVALARSSSCSRYSVSTDGTFVGLFQSENRFVAMSNLKERWEVDRFVLLAMNKIRRKESITLLRLYPFRTRPSVLQRSSDRSGKILIHPPS